jgi:alpha-ketoglutarate-dependent taurine dioxygenase
MSAPEARPLHPALGAEVTGLDVSRRLDDDEIRFLRGVFDEHGLVLFRDVDPDACDRARQAYLCELLRVADHVPSEEEAHALAEQQPGFWISNKMEGAAGPFGSLMFHADSMWSPYPFEILSLIAVDVQPPVTPTLFASATRAWTKLPDDLKAKVRDAVALNVSGPEYLPKRRVEAYEGRLSQGSRDYVPSFEWPVVRTHPRTGQELLYLCQANTHSINGLDPDASEDLIEQLFAVLYAPENVLTYEWRDGDLIVWDNWSLHHARPDVELEGPARTLRKIGLPMEQSIREASLIAEYHTVEVDS